MNFFTPAIMGPKAQKKRIIVDMVGAPQTQTFVHAAHASDAEQAEVILNRWGRDGVGKVADPTWVEPTSRKLFAFKPPGTSRGHRSGASGHASGELDP